MQNKFHNNCKTTTEWLQKWWNVRISLHEVIFKSKSSHNLSHIAWCSAYILTSFLLHLDFLSREKWMVLRQLIPPLRIPPLSNMRGAWLGKYWGWKGIMASLVLTSMILNDEYFAIFYKHFWGQRVLWRNDRQTIILKLLVVRKS